VSFISLEHVKKQYRSGEVVTHALRDVSFEIGEGFFAVVVNFLGQRRMKRINMVESLKTNE
jgi:ABC-type Na+ transport system ATPase subunit NatA